MEALTLTLHKTKDTKNKVVYGTKTAASSRAFISTRTPWVAPSATTQSVISVQ